MTLLDSNNNPVNPQPSPFGPNLAIDPHLQYNYFATWTVGQTHHYKIRVDQGGSSFPTALVIYNLLVKISGGLVTLQESDVLRGNHLFHLIRLSSQGDITLASTLGSNTIDLYSMEPSNNLLFILAPEGATSSDGSSKTYSSLIAGFYGVSFGYDPSGSAGSTFFQSNSYDCPASKTFTDRRGGFLPCAGQG